MIVLDTNVVFAAMKPEPDAVVRAWLNEQAAETLYLSSVTLTELLFGIRALPAGRRKNLLDRALTRLLDPTPTPTQPLRRRHDLSEAEASRTVRWDGICINRGF
jgi:predicted nucleic acid-binding protein